MLARLARFPLPDPIPADHPARPLRGIHEEVFTNLVEIELGPGSIMLEVDFTQESVAPAPFPIHPADFQPIAVGETEIVAVRPFEYRTLETGFKGTERHFLPCPNWILELLIECVDVDRLKADRE